MWTTWKYNGEIIGRADNTKNNSFFLIYRRGKNFESDNLFESYKNSVCMCMCVRKNAVGATVKAKKEREEERKEDECWRYKNCRRKITWVRGAARKKKMQYEKGRKSENAANSTTAWRTRGKMKSKITTARNTREQLEGWRTRWKVAIQKDGL